MISGNPKIDRLMLAISQHEGWAPPSENKPAGGSRAYRNHNPGNLRASPFAHSIVEGYAIFRNDFIGWLALYWDLLQKSKGNTRTELGPNSTLRDLIFTYAPPSDNNNSEKYLQEVVKNSGLLETTTLKEIFSS